MIDYKKIQEELHPLLVKAEHVRKKHFFFQKGNLNSGGKSTPPVTFDISSDVFFFNFDFASL